MDEKKKDAVPTRQRGLLRITTDVLHELLCLPDGITVRDVDVQHNARGWCDRPCKAVVFILAGDGLPEVPDNERIPEITAVYERAIGKRFLRFESIDDD